MDYLGIITTNN